jgi:hypothetical protein
MPRPPLNRRRLLVPRVDSLEGRRLLSRAGLRAEEVTYARGEVADRDDLPAPVPVHVQASHTVSAISPLAEKIEAIRPPAYHARPEPTAIEVARAEYSEADDDSARPLLASAYSPPAVSGVFEAPSPMPLGGVSSVEGPSAAEIPRELPESAEVPGPERGAEGEIRTPPGAGLITSALPFSGEMLTTAMDEVLDRFDDLGLFDAVASSVTNPAAVLSAACLVTVGALEMARRLHPKDFERDRRRALSTAMVPGLRPMRMP